MNTDDDTGMLQDLLDLEEGMSPRELEFIEDLSHQVFDLDWEITDNQRDWLKRIWKRLCS